MSTIMSILYGIATGVFVASITIFEYGWHTPLLVGLTALSIALYLDHLMLLEIYAGYKNNDE